MIYHKKKLNLVGTIQLAPVDEALFLDTVQYNMASFKIPVCSKPQEPDISFLSWIKLLTSNIISGSELDGT